MNTTSLRRRTLTGIAALAVAGVPLFAAGCANPSGLSTSLVDGTAINISLSNRTTVPLTLVSASHGGLDPDWDQEAPQTLAPGALAHISDHSQGANTIDLEYKDPTGATYTFHAGDPDVGDTWVSHNTTSTSYDIYSVNGSGRTDNVAFMVYPGHEFDTSGAAQTYVVPPGVTQLTVDMVGGSTISQYEGTARGAEIKGVLAVTPGQVLTIGVGGNVPTKTTGAGWGLPWEGSSFSGGQGMPPLDDSIYSGYAGGGGGASVLVDQNYNMLLAVAGGAGGYGDCGGNTNNDNPWCWGGAGGYQGQLTGQNGGGTDGEPGGQAGSQTTAGGYPSPAGQSSMPPVGSNSVAVGGAGGGGFAGGGAGPNPPGGGGGAGSSYDAGLTNPTVSTATGTAHVTLVIPELASLVE